MSSVTLEKRRPKTVATADSFSVVMISDGILTLGTPGEVST